MRQKRLLETSIAKLKEAIDDTEARAEKWIDLTERTFNFATHARAEFLNGGKQKQREIFSALGSNIIFMNGKLQLEANSWLVEIAENYPPLEEEYLNVRTKDFASIKAKTEALTSVRTSWLPRSDSNRRPNG